MALIQLSAGNVSCRERPRIFMVFIPVFSRPEISRAHDRPSCHHDKQAVPAIAVCTLHTEYIRRYAGSIILGRLFIMALENVKAETQRALPRPAGSLIT